MLMNLVGLVLKFFELIGDRKSLTYSHCFHLIGLALQQGDVIVCKILNKGKQFEI